jgi:hypothetical protein
MGILASLWITLQEARPATLADKVCYDIAGALRIPQYIEVLSNIEAKQIISYVSAVFSCKFNPLL